VWTLDQQAAYVKQGIWPLAGNAVPYIEDVFQTWLVTPTSSNTTYSVTNGVDVSGKGGMVWMKSRTSAANNLLYDTVRGASAGSNNALISNSTSAQQTANFDYITGLSNGFTVNYATGGGQLTNNGINYASWTFREQAKFFDVVTWTGDGANRTIAHNLGSVPGCIIVKRTDTTGDWQVYHRSLANTQYMVLNTAAGVATGATRWNSTTPTSTVFSLGTDATVNASGGTYVAYVYAHDAGGFGLTGTDNVISCGSFIPNGSGNATVNLGYEPQWILAKDATDAGQGWVIQDVMRGMPAAPSYAGLGLFPYDSAAESTASSRGSNLQPTATGFVVDNSSVIPGSTYIYIAIRRGPMKVPTDATKVFAPVTRTGTNAAATVTAGFTPDLYNAFQTSGGNKFYLDRLRGRSVSLRSNSDAGETTSSNATFDLVSFDMNGVTLGPDGNISINTSAASYVNYFYKRAPQFFDEVCYSGTGTAMTVAHNLAAVPEFIIVKRRSGTETWPCYTATTGPTNRLQLYLDSGSQLRASAWNDTAPTSSVFTVGTEPNVSGQTYVAYLFATCPGVSKVGSYTGNGTTQAVACGFTGGARFVLIKRTDASGDWYVYDTARGMTVLTDPYLLLNTTAAETATLGSVITSTGGFTVNAAILAAINTNAASYIFLAIA
jgi:hypothetical protein